MKRNPLVDNSLKGNCDTNPLVDDSVKMTLTFPFGGLAPEDDWDDPLIEYTVFERNGR